MRAYSPGINTRTHWIRQISICFIAAVIALTWTHDPAHGAPEKKQEGSRFLLLRDKSSPTPTPTIEPTPSATPSPTTTPTPPPINGFSENSAAGSSAGLALGAMAGIFFVLRRKDKD